MHPRPRADRRLAGQGAARPCSRSFGWSPSEDTRAAAAADGFDVADTLDAALARAVQQDALVVLASPVTDVPGAAAAASTSSRPTVRLTDVASVKAVVQDEVADLAPRARYIGSHPMAGTAALRLVGRLGRACSTAPPG